ncbi:MAG: exodeoxyribonuclease VII large subunit [Coriobacteriia bacterium]|nr:exodeoxyribonuclease VII large subunit [Coriobacteriia bacterium]
MPENRAVSVSEAVACAKRALEGVRLRVVGEVSEFADKPGYRAAYFTVSDGSAAMSCLMWREQYEASGVVLRCGMLVEMAGHFSAYAAKGRMQFVVRSLSLAGEGRLRLQVAELARRLEAEGLMHPERKRALPAYPGRIGVVTSPRGKAVHDVLRTLRRRYPLAEILLAGVPVEGVEAPSAIAEGLDVVAAAHSDVVLLVRGGGSYEDLMPFNNEQVARAIVACPVPVVTGIGHEPDTSIADMVADVRASTPTAAAESVAPSVEELGATLHKMRRMLGRALQHRVQAAEHRLGLLVRRPVFTDCSVLVGPAAQALDQAGIALRRSLPERLQRDAESLYRLSGDLERIGSRMLPPVHDRVERLGWDLGRAAMQLMGRAGDSVGHTAARLHDLSPVAILGRGYAVCRTADAGSVIRSATQVSLGDRVNVLLGEGSLGCVVESTEKEKHDG